MLVGDDKERILNGDWTIEKNEGYVINQYSMEISKQRTTRLTIISDLLTMLSGKKGVSDI